MPVRYEYLFDVSDLFGGGRACIWTGGEPIDIGGETFTPTNLVMDVSLVSGQFHGAETRASITLLNTAATLSTFVKDPGPAQVTIRQLANGAVVPRAFTGRLTSPVLEGNFYKIDVVDRRGDPIRPLPRFWSDDDQQRRFSGDRGLQYMRQIAAGVDVKWP